MKANVSIALVFAFLILSILQAQTPAEALPTPDTASRPDRFFFVDPPEIHFGDVRMDESRVQLITITNPAPAPMFVGVFVLGDGGAVDLQLAGRERADTLIFDLPPFGSRLVELLYTPQLPGFWGTLLQVVDMATMEMSIIPVDAHNMMVFYPHPASYNFGTVHPGELHSFVLELHNPNLVTCELNARVEYLTPGTGLIDLLEYGGVRPESLSITLETDTTKILVNLFGQSPGAGSAQLFLEPSHVDWWPEVITLGWENEEPEDSTLGRPRYLKCGDYIIPGVTVNVPMTVTNNTGATVAVGQAARNASSGTVDLNPSGGGRADSLFYVLPPHGSIDITASVYTWEIGPWSACMFLHDLTNGYTFEIPMSGYVRNPSLFITPLEMNFGNIYAGQQYSQVMDVYNQSDSILTISHYVTGDDGSVNFNLVGRDRTDSLSYDLAPLSHQMVEVQLTLAEPGPMICSIWTSVPATGELHQTPLSANAALHLHIAPLSVDFGILPVNGEAVQVLDCYWDGTFATKTHWYVTGDDGSTNFNLVGRERTGELDFWINPEQSFQVQITYTALVAGPWDNTLVVHDSVGGTDYFIPLHANVLASSLVLTPQEISFGTAILGQQYVQLLDVYNQTGITLNIDHYIEEEDRSSAITVHYNNRADTLEYFIPPFGHMLIDVSFNGEIPGPYQNLIIAQVQETGETFFTPMYANVVQALEITPLEVHLGDVLSDETRVQIFEFTNFYPYPIEISHYVTSDDGSINLNLIGRERADTVSFVLVPMQTQQVEMVYTPQTPGYWTCDMQAFDHTNLVSYFIPVDAYNIPVFYAEPLFYDFGTVVPGYTYSSTFQIFNPNSYDQEIHIETVYLFGDIGCINLEIMGGFRPDSLTAIAVSEETLNVKLDLTPLSSTPGEVQLELTNSHGYQEELVRIWIPGQTIEWLPYYLDFGVVYIQSDIEGYNLMYLLQHLQSGIDVSAYAAAHPNAVSLTDPTEQGGRDRADSVYFHMDPGVEYAMEIRLYPEQVGAWSDSLVLYCHTTGETFYVPMTATVMEEPSIHINPPDLNFGNVYPGELRVLVMDVHNETDSILTISHYVTSDDGTINLNLIGKSRPDSLSYTIQPQENVMVEVHFLRTEQGPYDNSIMTNILETGEAFETPIAGFVTPPLYIAPAFLDFGNVLNSSVVSQVMGLQNASDSTLTISHYVTSDDGAINLNLIGRDRTDSLAYQILPWQTQEVQVTFTALEPGPYDNTIMVHESGSGADFYIPVHAHVVDLLDITPQYVNFGEVTAGDTLYQTFSFTNYSTETMNVSHYVTSDDGSINLNLIGRRERSDSLYFTLLPAESRQVQMTARINAVGPWSRTLMAGSADARNWFDIIVDAFGLPDVLMGPPHLDFGEVQMGGSSERTVKSEPRRQIELPAFQYEWSFYHGENVEVDLEGNPRSRDDSLLVIQSCNDTVFVRVTFTPDIPGPWSDELVIAELNSGMIYNIPMSAYVLPPPPLIITPLEVHFGNVPMNETRIQPFYFTNNSDVPLQISHHVTGDDGSVNLNLIGRVRSDSLYFELAPHLTATVMMEFTPQTPGFWSCNMTAYEHTTGTLQGFTVDSNNLPVVFISVPVDSVVVRYPGEIELTSIEVENPQSFPLLITADVEDDDWRSKITYTGLERADSLEFTVAGNSTAHVGIRIEPLHPGLSRTILGFHIYAYNTEYEAEVVLNIGAHGPNLRISRLSDNILLEWDPVPDAIGYNIYTSDNPYGPFQIYGTVQGTSQVMPTGGYFGAYIVTVEF